MFVSLKPHLASCFVYSIRISLYKYCFRFIPTVSIAWETCLWWLLHSPPLPSPCSYICFHFSLCVWQTAKKFQTVVALSQQPLLQLSLGRMARVSHLIMNALPGSWAWGRFSGGTVETWSGELGSVQLNLSIKTQEPGHSNTIMIVLQEKQQGPTSSCSVAANEKKVAEKTPKV